MCHVSEAEGVLSSAEVITEGFRHYPNQRSAILDDIMGLVLPNLPMGKRTQRDFLGGDASQLRIQMLSALMLQLVQVACPATLHSSHACPSPQGTEMTGGMCSFWMW